MAQATRSSVSLQMPPEVFVIVRPPPSKHQHPSNLQIQLLNTANRPSGRPSGEYSRSSTLASIDSPASSVGASSFDAVAAASVGGGVKRSSSIKSGRSARSRSSSRASTTASGTGRRTIPLYNLQFHNVLPTTVTDAGTDERIAKFLKRGIDIVDLGIFDPTDIAAASSSRSATSTPALSASASSPSLDIPSSPSSSSQANVESGFLSKFKRLSFRPPKSPSAGLPASASFAGGVAPADNVVPLFRSVSREASSRAVDGPLPPPGYEFVVRKWTRRDLEVGNSTTRSTVSLEWRRQTKGAKTGARSRKRDGQSSATTTPYGSPTPLSPFPTQRRAPVVGESATADPNKLRRKERSRPTSMHESAVDLPAEADGAQAEDKNASDGDESDPEDSERPWLCHLVLRGAVDSSLKPTFNSKRILLGTLTPAPHHPKLVATLSVPASLSPVQLPFAGNSAWLTVEEMKDVMGVTCLWLVVREELGGLAGARRRGEGREGPSAWRIVGAH